jgi:predicted nucleic acid-binding protein
MYLDTAYIAKCYLPEPDSPGVRKIAFDAAVRTSSVIAIAEMATVLHRHLREGKMTRPQIHEVLDAFLEHVRDRVWTLVPVEESLLRQAAVMLSTASESTFLRAADAIHLVTAMRAGEDTIWTNDRHLLAAATHFGIRGRSV